MMQAISGQATALDLAKWPAAQKLVSRCCDFCDLVRNLTPGKELEARLNREFGPGTQPFDDMRRYVTQGLEEGWVATEEISGRVYRRSKIAEPSEQTHYLSIVTVYMESHGAGGDQEEQKVLRGRYHRHPYGEINCVVPLDDKAQLKGMQGWQGAGWTSPGRVPITTWKSGVEP